MLFCTDVCTIIDGTNFGPWCSYLPASPLLEWVSEEYELNSNSGKTSMQFQGKCCPLLLTASLLSGLTELISCTNNNFYQPLADLSISYIMRSHRQSCTILLSKRQRHSREVLSCTWEESWLHWCWRSP